VSRNHGLAAEPGFAVHSILESTHPPHLHRFRLAARTLAMLAMPLGLLMLACAVAFVAILLAR
jgi:hypothetical protein